MRPARARRTGRNASSLSSDSSPLSAEKSVLPRSRADAVDRIPRALAQHEEPLLALQNDRAHELVAVGRESFAGAIGTDLVGGGVGDVVGDVAVAADALCRGRVCLRVDG